jgi:wobble nucleotide-excising tRNase
MLEPNDDNQGYIIKRDGHPAKNLSEGEKTAIAFSYFIVKVGEKEFKMKDGIIFIDDPISSFDSNFTYHAFSLMKNHFGEVGQLFISTHNFQFFNLVKDWFARKNRNTEDENKNRKLEGKEPKTSPCEFYMIKSVLIDEKRNAKIVELEHTLKNNKSEYAFLFGLLNDFNNKTEEPTFEEIYNIANIGRRFFDIFADFKIPTNTKEQKEKIDLLVKEINDKTKDENDKISAITCDKVFWLINGFSHNSDPLCAIEHKDKNESKEAIKILMKIIKESDPNHYDILEKNLK